jgi:regulator of nucleoside diphosphate kinase
MKGMMNMLLANRILSSIDRERLIPVVERARSSWLTYAPYLDRFHADLRRSRAVPSSDVPGDVITMNSRFALSRPGGDGLVSCTLVYPEEESAQFGKLSVLTPMGTALLGARVGEEVCWVSTDGPEVATVERLIYQPEADGSAR